MTDNEIIKALEHCCGDTNRDNECTEDLCYQAVLPESRDGDTRWCRQWLMKDSLDLINRQKAEIEKLKDEKLKHFLAYEKDRKRVKSEATKEVLLTLYSEAESSDKYIREHDDSEAQRAYNQALWKAYNLVKEMAGETDV